MSVRVCSHADLKAQLAVAKTAKWKREGRLSDMIIKVSDTEGTVVFKAMKVRPKVWSITYNDAFFSKNPEYAEKQVGRHPFAGCRNVVVMNEDGTSHSIDGRRLPGGELHEDTK